MSRTFECGDTATLVSYQYGECEPPEHTAVAAHLAGCPACAAEVEALGATRRQLAAWAPPELDGGVGVTVDRPAPALRPSRWWRHPLPGWAQAAAAVVLFAGGLSMGGVASVWLAPTAPQAAETVAAPASAPPAASAADLLALERRLQAEIADVRGAAATPAASEGPQVLDEVRALIRASEERQRRELALRTVDVLRDFDAQRRVDLAQVERAVGELQGLTGAEVAAQRQLLDYLIRVSQHR